MRRILILALVLGLAVFGLIYAEISLPEVTEAFSKAGWGIALVFLARIVVTFLLAVAWHWLFPKETRPALHICVKIRIVRDAINALLPVAQVGGDVVGARLVSLRSHAPAMAAASVVTDVFLQIVTQFVFTLVALALLIRHGGGDLIATNVMGGMMVVAPALLALFLIQRRDFGAILLSVLKRLAGDRALGATDAFYAALAVVQARRGALTASGVVHLLAWILGSLEVWFAFQFMGYPIGIAEALMIEALGHAIRGAAFAIPGAIGVQEAGLVILSGIFGIPPEPALAMSLIKRVADLAIGLPGLLLWHQMETGAVVQSGKPDETLLPIPQKDTHLQ